MVAYEMRISDWSSDVCSSDLVEWAITLGLHLPAVAAQFPGGVDVGTDEPVGGERDQRPAVAHAGDRRPHRGDRAGFDHACGDLDLLARERGLAARLDAIDRQPHGL